MFTVRVYYNKDLYRKTAGTDIPPRTYEELVATCAAIKSHARQTASGIVPIAGGKYQGRTFVERYSRPFFYGLIPEMDLDLNGSVDALESYHGYVNGQWSFLDDRFLASWKCMAELAQNFQGGWLAANRDDTMFLFIQGRAVMIASGSWDAPSLKAQIGDSFEMGVFDFPMPLNHPEYSKFVKGPQSEASIGGGIPWSITKQSRHKELCVDFLRFCTTRKNNEAFNRAITWIPVILGAELAPELQPFRPRLEGFSGSFGTRISTEVSLREAGNKWNLFTREMSPEEYGRALKSAYEKTATDGFADLLDVSQRAARNLDRILAAILVRQMITSESRAERDTEQQRAAQILDSGLSREHALYAHKARFRPLDAGDAAAADR